MKTIKITADNKISIIDVDFGDLLEATDRYVATMTTKQVYDFFKRPIVMVIDEEEYPEELELNVIGTAFNGGTIVFNNIILAQPAGDNEELEGIGEPEEMLEMLVEQFKFLEKVN